MIRIGEPKCLENYVCEIDEDLIFAMALRGFNPAYRDKEKVYFKRSSDYFTVRDEMLSQKGKEG